VLHVLPPSESEVEQLARLFDRGPVAILTGAGISTESGIPDYRGPETRRRARNPVQYHDFLHVPAARKRYWARSMFGFPRMAAAQPNAGHFALRAIERAELTTGIVTQNVDGLHARAGSEDAIELHGALREAVCLRCAARVSRHWLQAALERENPDFFGARPELAPDGDADVEGPELDDFRVIDCACGGPLKPDVVFFGESVPKGRVNRAMALVERASALLVVGSSLAVYSGLRFVRAAARRGVPAAIVSLGETRADGEVSLRVDASAGATLTLLVERLLGGGSVGERAG
jgi:NAD+-dependent protein deacetylase sirtuin 4